MKNNDLSNRSAPVIAFRVENFLVEYKEETIRDKIGNFILGKDKRAELNLEVLSTMEYIFRHTDLTSYLIIEKGKMNDDLQHLILHVPYGRIIEIIKPVEIAIMLNTNHFTYYVDNDEIRKSIIGHKDCIDLETLNNMVRVGGNRNVAK